MRLHAISEIIPLDGLLQEKAGITVPAFNLGNLLLMSALSKLWCKHTRNPMIPWHPGQELSLKFGSLAAEESCALSSLLPNASIPEAIVKRFTIEVFYPPGLRILEPHAIGYGSDGQILIRAFQTSGASASGEQVNWKLMRLDRLHSPRYTGDTFAGPRAGYRRNDSAMKNGIIAQL